MQNNITLLTLASTLALAVGSASAQTATPATPANTAATGQVRTFSDVPAGHWAKDAVDLIVQKGLIQGFPDGTFRGNENLTRYQAALIFYRLLQSGALSSGTVTPADTTTIANGMQEVATELASVSSRVTDLEKLTADQQSRIAALEAQIAALNTGSSAAPTDTTAITARLDALEASVQSIPAGAAGPAGPQGPAGPAGPAGSSANTAALEARVAALEARAAQSSSTASTTTTNTGTNTAGTTGNNTGTTGTTTGNSANGTTSPTTIVIGGNGNTTSTSGTVAAANVGRLYVGAAYNYSLGGTPTNARSSYGAVVGSTSVFGGIGAQVGVDYEPTAGTINVDADATYRLDTGGSLTPYVGAGFGLTSSNSRASAATKTTDYSVNGLVGVDYRFTDNLGVFGEAQGRYYLSSNGAGTLLATPSAGFGSSIKAGLKFFF